MPADLRGDRDGVSSIAQRSGERNQRFVHLGEATAALVLLWRRSAEPVIRQVHHPRDDLPETVSDQVERRAAAS
jgi:hypothetical protein